MEQARDLFDQGAMQFEHSRTSEQALKRIRVLLFDLLPTVPYYTGHLCVALNRLQNIEVILGSATYAHDTTFFQRMGLHNTPGMLDCAYRMRTPSIRRIMNVLQYLLNMGWLTARCWRRKPDVIHVQFTPLLENHLPFEVWFLRAARASGARLVYTVHNILPHECSEAYRRAYSQVYNLVDCFVCHDVVTKDRLSNEFCVDPARINVVPHGPLLHRASGNSTQSSVLSAMPCGTRVVLWHGIIRPYKGIQPLLEAWKEVQQTGSNAVLAIVGTGEADALGEVREQVKSLGIATSVHLDFRFVPVEELAAYLQAADILVYPYTSITTSGALMTGIGYGKPIVASDLLAFRQLLQHEKNALLVTPGNAKELAGALLQLISDDELRTRLAGQLNSDFGNLSDWNEIANDTVRTYRQACSTAPSLNARTA
jgi:glycosyltransferase involved in cell wall biosynthesis